MPDVTGKLGTAEVKSVLALALSLGRLIESLSDGIGLGDIGALLSCAKKVSPAIGAFKSGLVIPELKDLSDEEKADLKAFVSSEFDLQDDNIEFAVEKGLSIAIDLCDLLKVVG
jgi:hypothetical protein